MTLIKDFLVSTGALIVVLGVLVYVHELGHFLAAKLFGVRVDVFSLGFGPRLFGWRRGDTDYRVSGIPLGGYVKMAGELGGDESGDPAHFTSKPRWQRLIVMLAGPAMNISLAILLWWALFMHGTVTYDIPEGPPVVEAVEAESPAAAARLERGDRILQIDGQSIGSVEDYENALMFHPGKTVTYRIERGKESLTKQVALATHPRWGIGWDGVRVAFPIIVADVTSDGPAAQAGIKVDDRIVLVNGHIPSGGETVSKLVRSSTGPVVVTVLRNGQELAITVTPRPGDAGARTLGIKMSAPLKLVKYPPGEAFGESLRVARQQAGMLFRTLSALVKREVGIGVLSGPVEIARVSGEQARQGTLPFLAFMAFVSIQLGIFNLLPIPVLDGGNILILLIESALRRDVSTLVKERVLQVGFVLLIFFAVVVMFKDVGKLISRPPEKPAATAPAK